MIRFLSIVYIMLLGSHLFAQGLYNRQWAVGLGAPRFSFKGDTSLPKTDILFPANAWCNSNASCIIQLAQSSICDSATGNIQFICTGARIFDTTGAIMENGDSLHYNMLASWNPTPEVPNNQGSIVLPRRGSKYWVFSTTATDSAYLHWEDSLGGFDDRFLYDELVMSEVDMSQNNGKGKVLRKRVPILTGHYLSASQLSACRHANGEDWWLIKHGELNDTIFRFLVTADSIYGPYWQRIDVYNQMSTYLCGQSCFSPDGSKYATVRNAVQNAGYGWHRSEVIVCDFDRSSGLMSNLKKQPFPYLNIGFAVFDSSIYGNSFYGGDGYPFGIAVSPNNKYVYITTYVRVLQYEYDEMDSAKAWSTVHFHPIFDTTSIPYTATYPYFSFYNQLQYGDDGRLYVGWLEGGARHMSYIQKPALKGDSCGFCNNCIVSPDTNINSPTFAVLTTPPNIPLYYPKPYVPDALQGHPNHLTTNLKIFPNPAHHILHLNYTTVQASYSDIRILDAVGRELVYIKSPKLHNQIELKLWPKGIYFVYSGGSGLKFIVE